MFRQAAAVAATVCAVLLPTFHSAARADAAAVQCATFTANGYLFDSTYESEGYVNGFLNIHLRLLPTYDDGRGWAFGFYLYSPDCSSEYVQATVPGFSLPAGDVDYSIRFTTQTHYQIWDDDRQEQLTAGPSPLMVRGLQTCQQPCLMEHLTRKLRSMVLLEADPPA